MDISAIQNRSDALCAMMLAKGLREPRACVHIKSHEQPCVGGEWKDASAAYGTAYDYFHADTLSEAFEKAEAMIEAMPDPEQRKLNEFMGALGKVIDLGRETGMEVEFVNPLVATMKKLSENALTFRPQAAE